ncbi:MAG: ATP-binding cassette domain-containing protein [Spirochaetes bacterium]|nr:ATP-binding cassette domain-containing protein [Spirochaetota bacterium]
MIELKNVSVSFGRKQVLNDFNLIFPVQKISILIGPSGCGKSTIVRLVNGLLTPDSGKVIFDKEELSTANVRDMRLKMGYVIQEGGLFPNLTAEENITLMASRRLKWSKSKISLRVEELCTLTHFDEENLNKYPAQLSGGQNQRVSLMRALMLNPDFLLLDEPFAALDPIIRSGLHVSLLEIFQKLRKTVIMVTHDLHEAAYLGDNIVLINDGSIVQAGSINELIDNPSDPFVTRFIEAQRSHLPEAKK